VTRIYFPDEEAANSADPLLSSIGDPVLRSTLVASAVDDRLLRFDIHLQGEDQTAFLDV
jgi:protocatechuate 3,4-dioxygenase alpha subunit